MATRNDIPFLPLAVESILNQTFTDFEFIIIDDASVDDTKAILDRYTDLRIRRIRNPENLGLTSSLIKGVSCAEGDFIARQDGDDISFPERLEKQVGFLKEFPQIGLVSCSYDWIDDTGHILDSIIYPDQNMALNKLLETGNIFAHGTVMFRKECIKTVGNYRASFLAAQDMDLWQRIATQYEVRALHATLYQARLRYSGISGVKNLRRQLAFDGLSRQLMNERLHHGREISPIPPDIEKAFPPDSSVLVKRLQYLTLYLYLGGQYKQASEALRDFNEILNTESVTGVKNLQEWMKNGAIKISNNSGSVTNGVDFIQWILSQELSGDSRRMTIRTLASFHADRAFLAYKNREAGVVVGNVLQAIFYDPRWLHNRGLLVILWRSLFQRYGI